MIAITYPPRTTTNGEQMAGERRYPLSHEHKVAFRTAAEIEAPLKAIADGYGSAGWKFLGRRLGTEGMMSAIALWWLSLNDAERLHVLAAHLPEVERMLGEDPTPQPMRPPQAGPAHLIGKRRVPLDPGLNPEPDPVPARKLVRSSKHQAKRRDK